MASGGECRELCGSCLGPITSGPNTSCKDCAARGLLMIGATASKDLAASHEGGIHQARLCPEALHVSLLSSPTAPGPAPGSSPTEDPAKRCSAERSRAVMAQQGLALQGEERIPRQTGSIIATDSLAANLALHLLGEDGQPDPSPSEACRCLAPVAANQMFPGCRELTLWSLECPELTWNVTLAPPLPQNKEFLWEMFQSELQDFVSLFVRSFLFFSLLFFFFAFLIWIRSRNTSLNYHVGLVPRHSRLNLHLCC